MKKYLDIVVLENQIRGALENCIESHGPITNEWIGSAAKRIGKQIYGVLNDPSCRGIWKKSKSHVTGFNHNVK